MTTQPHYQPAESGWYPDPAGTPRRRFFNGVQWTEVYDDFGGAPANDDVADTTPAKPGVGFGVTILAVIGLVMSMQSTSLLNGTGTIWLGVGIAAVAVAASFFLGAASWAKTVAVILLALALGSALYMEHQMDVQRNKISHIFDSSYTS